MARGQNQLRRLHRQRAVGAMAPHDGRERPGPTIFLSDHGVQRHAAGETNVGTYQRRQRRQCRSKPALHIARASADDDVLAHDGRERIARPLREGADGNDIHVAVEQQRGSAAVAERPHHPKALAARHLHAERWVRLECVELDWPHVDVHPEPAQSSRHPLLSRGLLSAQAGDRDECGQVAQQFGAIDGVENCCFGRAQHRA